MCYQAPQTKATIHIVAAGSAQKQFKLKNMKFTKIIIGLSAITTVFLLFALLSIVKNQNEIQKQNQKLISEILKKENGLIHQEKEIHEDEKLGSGFEMIPEVKANYYGKMGTRCFENLESSEKFKADAPWSTEFMQENFRNVTSIYSSGWNSYSLHEGKDRYLINNFDKDLNGDGLPDYVYINRSESRVKQDCVFLSNGQGWSPAYRCMKVQNSSTGKWIYFGDCAYTSSES